MQSLFLTAVFFSLMLMGFSAAFAAALGFVWVDVVKPQQLAYSIISGWPLSMVAALVMLTQYGFNDRKAPPRFGIILGLLVFFALWITFTTSMSSIPDRAWQKWDWAFKVLIFTILIPFIFRSRVQIEAFILVLIFSAATIFCSAGVKTLLGGGGYGVLAVMGGGNSGLAEGSTLAVVCSMLIPLIVYVMRHNILFPKNLLTTCFFLGIIVTAVATVIGTSARTGIVVLAALGFLMLLKSPNKHWWLVALAIGAIAYLNIDLSTTTWGERMSTIESYDQDSSALGRIKVWEWTLDYVSHHPLGGGFDAYMHNRIMLVSEDGTITYYPEWQRAGKAFHSIYFEVLGEQGIPGFLAYIAMITICMVKLRALKKKWKSYPKMAWMVALSDALITTIFVFLAGGAFVGVAYQPFIFYMIGLVIALDQYSARVVREENLSLTKKFNTKDTALRET